MRIFSLAIDIMTQKTYNGFEGISVDGIDSPRLPIHREAGAEKRVSSAVATLFLKLDQSGICRAHTRRQSHRPL